MLFDRSNAVRFYRFSSHCLIFKLSFGPNIFGPIHVNLDSFTVTFAPDLVGRPTSHN
jgi:hypothetical protein